MHGFSTLSERRRAPTIARRRARRVEKPQARCLLISSVAYFCARHCRAPRPCLIADPALISLPD
nr:MAG TPA: hypothetical protein [Caudoviricetes sp.]